MAVVFNFSIFTFFWKKANHQGEHPKADLELFLTNQDKIAVSQQDQLQKFPTFLTK